MGWSIKTSRVSRATQTVLEGDATLRSSFNVGGQPSSDEVERGIARIIKPFIRDINHKHVAEITIKFTPD